MLRSIRTHRHRKDVRHSTKDHLRVELVLHRPVACRQKPQLLVDIMRRTMRPPAFQQMARWTPGRRPHRQRLHGALVELNITSNNRPFLEAMACRQKCGS